MVKAVQDAREQGGTSQEIMNRLKKFGEDWAKDVLEDMAEEAAEAVAEMVGELLLILLCVICTELRDQGRLPAHIWEADIRFTEHLLTTEYGRTARAGYLLWAPWVVK